MHVWVTYTDGAGSGQSATASSANPVQVAGSNAAPTFAQSLYERTVAEGQAAGTEADAAIEAADTNNGDILEYSLTGADSENFDVDNSGQITTKPESTEEM